jgi:mannan endo-1,4-beta-mannosidase
MIIGMKLHFTICILTAAFIISSCKTGSVKKSDIQKDTNFYYPPKEQTADSLLTPETRALWINLKQLQGKGILFGQQDATLSGVDWKNLPDKSDIRDVTGTYPALYGWEISGAGNKANIDSVPFDLISRRIIETFNRGGINTVTWHLNNLLTDGTAWDVTEVVREILPDSALNKAYKSELENIAGFFKQLKDKEGHLVPVIFRPFQENNGNWFWWGKGHCTATEYIDLWRFTVSYLRDSLNVHNLLYAYSTDMFESREQYLERYPGDEWVDIMGCENYWDFQSGSTISNGIAQLRILVETAFMRKKLAALTECGFDGIPIKNWWTQFLLTPIEEDTLARNISYMMVWRNANRKHYYTPFPGQKSVADFIAFEKDSFTIFEQNLPDVYRIKGGN